MISTKQTTHISSHLYGMEGQFYILKFVFLATSVSVVTDNTTTSNCSLTQRNLHKAKNNKVNGLSGRKNVLFFLLQKIFEYCKTVCYENFCFLAPADINEYLYVKKQWHSPGPAFAAQIASKNVDLGPQPRKIFSGHTLQNSGDTFSGCTVDTVATKP